MIVYTTAKEISEEIDKHKQHGKTIGFVPTMGALHAGHLSLVEEAGQDCDIVVVSIFVNPTQFNNPDDLKRYPRTLDSDLLLLKKTKAKLVYTPSVNDIYPNEETKKTNFEFGNIGSVMEGKHRPGHFNGVAMVVKRLFEIVKPTKAYFGQKDIQQYLIIKYLNNNYLQNFNIDVVKCPIIREDDGLAMSSRNVLLTDEQRKQSAIISQTLFEVKSVYKKYTVEELKKQVVEKINSETSLNVEYFEIVSDPDLQEISNWEETDLILACIAVNVGKIRLIDNIYFD